MRYAGATPHLPDRLLAPGRIQENTGLSQEDRVGRQNNREGGRTPKVSLGLQRIPVPE